MLYRLTLYVFLFLLSSTSQAQRLEYAADIPIEKLRLVLEQTQGGTVSELLTDLEYIPLQGGKNDLLNYISDMSMLDDRIGIIDTYGGNGYFYLYGLDGRLIKKITKIDGFKRPAGDTNKSLFYDIRKEKGKFVLSRGEFEVIVDRDGQIVDTLTRRFTSDKVSERLKFNDQSEYTYFSSRFDEKRKDTVVLKLNDRRLIHYNPLDTIRTYFSVSNVFSAIYKDRAFAVFPNQYRIFELQAEGISRVYELIFPLRNTLAFDDPDHFSDQENYQNYLRKNMDKVYGIGRLSLYHDFLLIYVARWANPNWIAYNLKTKEIYGLDNIIADPSNDYLDFFNTNHLFVEGDYIYSFIYPNDVRQAKNKSLDERHSVKKSFEVLEKANNPILVRFKLKTR